MQPIRSAIVVAAGIAAATALTGIVARRRRRALLVGTVALVTGGGRGLGYLIARRLVGEGCRVVICGRDQGTLDRAVARLRRETGAVVRGWRCDVGDREAVEGLVARIIAELGRVDIVVNNAGIIQVGPLDTMRLEDFHAAMDTDYWGSVHTTLAALPHMRTRGDGRIVNITSIAASLAVPHLLPYDAAKHAKLGFSDGLRAELAGEGIAVTTVMPGLMRTGSPVHVEFRGQPEKEYAWFAAGSILPLSTMSAERAARRIVKAIRRREARVTLSWQAKLLRITHDLAPGATVRALSVVKRLLPRANGTRFAGRDAAHGTALRGTLPTPIEYALDRAAWRTNQ